MLVGFLAGAQAGKDFIWSLDEWDYLQDFGQQGWCWDKDPLQGLQLCLQTVGLLPGTQQTGGDLHHVCGRAPVRSQDRS